MAKKLSMVSVLLSVAVLLALVYFFRPQTFNFLTQGFSTEKDLDDEGFTDEPEDFEEEGFTNEREPEDFEEEGFTAEEDFDEE